MITIRIQETNDGAGINIGEVTFDVLPSSQDDLSELKTIVERLHNAIAGERNFLFESHARNHFAKQRAKFEDAFRSRFELFSEPVVRVLPSSGPFLEGEEADIQV